MTLAHRLAHGGRQPAHWRFAEMPLRYLVFARRCLHYSYRQQLCKNTLAISLLYNDMVLDHPRAHWHGERWHWRLRRPHGTHADLSTRPTLT